MSSDSEISVTPEKREEPVQETASQKTKNKLSENLISVSNATNDAKKVCLHGGGQQCAEPSECEYCSVMSFSTYAPRVKQDAKFNPLSLLVYIQNVETGDEQQTLARIMLDDCSQLTAVRSSVASKLELGKRKVDVSFSGTGGKCQVYKDQKSVRFQLKSLDGKFTSPILSGVTLPEITKGYRRPIVDFSKHENLKNIKTLECSEDYSEEPIHPMVDVLVGIPFRFHLLAVSTVKPGRTLSDPIAVHTPFGTCVSAPMYVTTNQSHHEQNTHVLLKEQGRPTESNSMPLTEEEASQSQCLEVVSKQTSQDAIEEYGYWNVNGFEQEVEKRILEWFQLDSLGISGAEESPGEETNLSYEELRCRQIIQDGTTYNGKFYTTVLPWKDKPIPETNRERAFQLAKIWVKSYQKILKNWTTG